MQSSIPVNNVDVQALAQDSTLLCLKNADPRNWEWEFDETVWKRGDKYLDAFHKKFKDFHQGLSNSPPFDPMSESLPLPRPFDKLSCSLSSSIFIPSSYAPMFQIILAQSVKNWGKHGVIVTGQRGVGKTLFSFYLLVRLLALNQVVLYSPDGGVVYIFYHSGVYTWEGSRCNISLPMPVPSSNVFIWSLFDVHDQNPPWPALEIPCFPVQTCLPDPSRYRVWMTQNDPLFTALPLWTHEELAQGLKYQEPYQRLVDGLYKFYHQKSAPNPLCGFASARKLLVDHFGGDSESPSPDQAIDYLLTNAISHFGYSPRDVFDAVFDFDQVISYHEMAFADATYSDLHNALSSLSTWQDSSPSASIGFILAVSPVYHEDPLLDILWNVDFKSEWVARSVIPQLNRRHDSFRREQINYYFRNNPEGHALAERLYELLTRFSSPSQTLQELFDSRYY